MKRVSRHRPSPSMVVALTALVIALSGTAVAATRLVNGDKLIKQGTLSGNRLRNHTITGTQVNLNKLGKVPSATTADTATSATNAGHATSADTATSATNAGHATSAGTATSATSAGHATSADTATSATTAGNANGLGGVPASNYVTPGSTLAAGQTESGVFSATGNVSGGYSAYAIGFNPRLPAAIPETNAHYMIGATSTECPGLGQAASGNLCVYQAAATTSTFDGFFKITSPSGSLVETQGTLMIWSVGGTQSRVWGTWAVTP